MQKSPLLNSGNWLTLFRQHETRTGFFILYVMLLVWPFFSRTPWSIPHQYFYYFGVWLALICGLAVQGYLVIRQERQRPSGSPSTPNTNAPAAPPTTTANPTD